MRTRVASKRAASPRARPGRVSDISEPRRPEPGDVRNDASSVIRHTFVYLPKLEAGLACQSLAVPLIGVPPQPAVWDGRAEIAVVVMGHFSARLRAVLRASSSSWRPRSRARVRVRSLPSATAPEPSFRTHCRAPGLDSPAAPLFYVAATPTATQGMSYAPPRSKGPAIAANVALIAASSSLGSAAARAARGPPMAVCISQ